MEKGRKVDQGEALIGRIKGIFRTSVSLIFRYPLGVSIPHTHCSTYLLLSDSFGERKERHWGRGARDEKKRIALRGLT